MTGQIARLGATDSASKRFSGFTATQLDSLSAVDHVTTIFLNIWARIADKFVGKSIDSPIPPFLSCHYNRDMRGASRLPGKIGISIARGGDRTRVRGDPGPGRGFKHVKGRERPRDGPKDFYTDLPRRDLLVSPRNTSGCSAGLGSVQ